MVAKFAPSMIASWMAGSPNSGHSGRTVLVGLAAGGHETESRSGEDNGGAILQLDRPAGDMDGAEYLWSVEIKLKNALSDRLPPKHREQKTR